MISRVRGCKKNKAVKFVHSLASCCNKVTLIDSTDGRCVVRRTSLRAQYYPRMHPVVDILKGGLIPRFPARSYLRCFYAYHVHSWRSTRKARVQRFSQVDCLLVPEIFHHCARVQGCYNQKKLRGPCILCPLAATRLLLSTAQASDVAHTTSAEH